jgi:hypothetical protein
MGDKVDGYYLYDENSGYPFSKAPNGLAVSTSWGQFRRRIDY